MAFATPEDGRVTVGLAGLRRKADDRLVWAVIRDDGSEELASLVFYYHPLSAQEGIANVCDERSQCHAVHW